MHEDISRPCEWKRRAVLRWLRLIFLSVFYCIIFQIKPLTTGIAGWFIWFGFGGSKSESDKWVKFVYWDEKLDPLKYFTYQKICRFSVWMLHEKHIFSYLSRSGRPPCFAKTIYLLSVSLTQVFLNVLHNKVKLASVNAAFSYLLFFPTEFITQTYYYETPELFFVFLTFTSMSFV